MRRFINVRAEDKQNNEQKPVVNTPIETPKQNIEVNQTKQCIINQFFGIGDIIFIEPICRHYFQQGYEIIFPVIPKYLDIAPYFPYIKFVDKEKYQIDYEEHSIIETSEKLILPLRWSREFFNSPLNDTMKNKYLMLNFNLEMWRGTTWLRHRWKENNLFNELGLKDGDKYNLVNINYFSFDNRTVNINVKNKNKNILFDFIKGYTLFDWAKVIENATEIHSVNTSIIYLLEILELKAKEIHLYSRNVKGRDFQQTEYLRTKNYILHD